MSKHGAAPKIPTPQHPDERPPVQPVVVPVPQQPSPVVVPIPQPQSQPGPPPPVPVVESAPPVVPAASSCPICTAFAGNSLVEVCGDCLAMRAGFVDGARRHVAAAQIPHSNTTAAQTSAAHLSAAAHAIAAIEVLDRFARGGC